MKNKFVFCVSTILVFVLGIAIPVYAYAPESMFYCDITEEKIPENTVYIDLLLPISTEDEGYVSYNQSNGEQYGITQESEIVNYCEEGYRSYTFHIVDAQSRMRPYYICDFMVSRDVYLLNKELLQDFESDCISNLDGGYAQYEVDVEYKSEKKELLKGIGNILDIDMSEKFRELRTKYGDSFETKYGYNYCCKKYGYAKMAYLDEKGNIIAVSSKADIYVWSLRDVHLNLSLSGTDFTSNPEICGPPGFLLWGFAVVYVLFDIAVIIYVIVGLAKERRRSSK